MQPLYFLPDLSWEQLAPGNRLDRDVLARVGLWDAWRDVEAGRCSRQQPHRQPGDKPGLLVAANTVAGAAPERFGYYPDEQTWHDCGSYWLGLDPRRPPTPDDLARATRLPGHDVVLGGMAWHVPIVRRFNHTTELPRVAAWGADGAFSLNVREQWAWLWDKSGRVWDLVFAQEGEGDVWVDLQEVCDLAVLMLSANYRLDRQLQTALQLVDTVNWQEVLGAAVDWPAVQQVLEAQKKSEPSVQPGTANMPPGAAGDSPTTPPVAAS